MEFNNASFKIFDKFLDNNKGICIRTLNLLDGQEISRLSFKRIEKYKEEIITELKVWQRLLKVLPECDRQYEIVKELLLKKIYSAVQLATIPRQQFIKEYGYIFTDYEQLETVYKNATAVKTQVMLKYMDVKQNTEAHINATLFHNKA